MKTVGFQFFCKNWGKNFAGSIFSANLVFRGNATGDQSVLVDWKNRSAVENKANLALSRDGIFDWNRRKKELTSKKVHCILTVNMVSATTACSRVHRPFVQNCCFSNFSTLRFAPQLPTPCCLKISSRANAFSSRALSKKHCCKYYHCLK